MIRLHNGRANVVIDAQWGSTGKGKLYGWLYGRYEIGVSVCDFMPNAGHTYVDDSGVSFVTKQVPMGLVFGVPLCLIGPHAAINKKSLKEELDAYWDPAKTRLLIHPLASIVQQRDRAHEQTTHRNIASTMKGGCSAAIRKMGRRELEIGPDELDGKGHLVAGSSTEPPFLAKDDPDLQQFIGDTHLMAQEALKDGECMLVETAQGFDLGLNHGYEWPYVTSRDCLVGRALDNAGISPRNLGMVIACFRTYPIRVGNIEGGHSGPCYSDQHETTWEDLSERLGREVCEYTTVTKRKRRVFSFSWTQTARFMQAVRPHYAFLNFTNYLLLAERKAFVEDVHRRLRNHECELELLGTGRLDSDVEHLGSWPSGWSDRPRIRRARRNRQCQG